MAIPQFGFGAVVESTERLQRRLHEHYSEPSDIQGVMAVFQLLAAVLMNFTTWAWPWTYASGCCLPFMGVLLLWHGVFRGLVLSPLPYGVLLVQLVVRCSLGDGITSQALMLPLILLATAVNQRALENLVHEASHHCLYRKAHLNGCAPPACASKVAPTAGYFERAQGLASTVFASLIFKDIEAYHDSHSVHHGHFGEAARDPDISIYERAKASSATEVVHVLLQWYWENLQGALNFVGLARHAEQRLALSVFLMVAAALLGPAALVALMSVWLVAYFVVLPPLRMVAEQEEHAMLIPDREAFMAWLKNDAKYNAEWSALSAEPDKQEQFVDALLTKLQWTMSRTNVGWVHHWVFHPCGDGVHAVHHLSPRVPFHQLKRAHQDLEFHEPIFSALCNRNVTPIIYAFDLLGRS